MDRKWTFRLGFMVVVLLFTTFLPVQVSQGTTWGEFNLVSQEELRDEDLIDLNHPGLFPDLAGRAPKRVEPREDRTPVPPEATPPDEGDKPTRFPTDEKEPFDKFGQTQRIHFDYDKSEIKPEWVEALKKNAEWIKKNPQYRILIEGHCDERGSNEYNIALGERRANSTKRFLIKLGVDPDRMITKSWGEEKPLDLGKTEQAYALNRRAEFFAIRTTE
ncbi:MAG: peptidoglycan-associated lipoprotein Pal [bacterium]